MMLGASRVVADERPPFVDYCQQLEQEIQGRKHGFMAGNLVYYVGGFHASWSLIEDETLGLTHPFYHDLRGRGAGLAESQLQGAEHTGIGNDFTGWEFYKDTRVLYGTVIVDGRTFKHPRPKRMTWRPDQLRCEYEVGGVRINEIKFISQDDVALSIISTSRPVTLVFEGRSFFHRNSLTSTAEIELAPSGDAIIIAEGGTATCRPDPNGQVAQGPCIYDGMTTAMGVSSNMSETWETSRNEQGVQYYSFSLPCDEEGIVVSWAMHDDKAVAAQLATSSVRNSARLLAAKTTEMNRQLNEEVPYFRCPDQRCVDIYYYLWSLYLMYYIDVGRDWESVVHTQTAVNNFLGMHRYDATFQIKVGAWVTDKPRYAYGNVLTWKPLTLNQRYRELPNGLRLLSDNKGTTWHSGVYGGETAEHVLGAWQIYQHTGDADFLEACYEGHFRTLFWNRIPSFAMNQFEVAEVLEAIARQLGRDQDVSHWQEIENQDPEHIRRMFDQRWEMNGVRQYFAAPDNGLLTTNGFWAMRSKHFPNEYAKPMVDSWMLDRDQGFYGQFFPMAMSRESMARFANDVDQSFGYTPDTAYFTLDGLFRQGLTREATSLTLNHLLNYNYNAAWDIPMAPEAYRRDGKPFGDQYSNFNAGKILLFLEGFAGLDVSIPERRLTISPALPKDWKWMEVRLPIEGVWTKVRYTHDGVEVKGSPLNVETRMPSRQRASRNK